MIKISSERLDVLSGITGPINRRLREVAKQYVENIENSAWDKANEDVIKSACRLEIEKEIGNCEFLDKDAKYFFLREVNAYEKIIRRKSFVAAESKTLKTKKPERVKITNFEFICSECGMAFNSKSHHTVACPHCGEDTMLKNQYEENLY